MSKTLTRALGKIFASNIQECWKSSLHAGKLTLRRRVLVAKECAVICPFSDIHCTLLFIWRLPRKLVQERFSRFRRNSKIIVGTRSWNQSNWSFSSLLHPTQAKAETSRSVLILCLCVCGSISTNTQTNAYTLAGMHPVKILDTMKYNKTSSYPSFPLFPVEGQLCNLSWFQCNFWISKVQCQ